MIRIEVFVRDAPGIGGKVETKCYANPTTTDREHRIAEILFEKMGEVAQEIAALPEIYDVNMIERIFPHRG